MTKRHKHADMIIAKAENMDLVLLCRDSERDKQLPKDLTMWGDVDGYDDFPEFLSTYDYFLCLPQHKEACLHWLNGGDVQQSPLEINQWTTTGTSRKWLSFGSFMNGDLRFRIKPRKEKRWIAVHKSQAKAEVFYKENIIDKCLSEPMYDGYQKFEIEVEAQP